MYYEWHCHTNRIESIAYESNAEGVPHRSSLSLTRRVTLFSLAGLGWVGHLWLGWAEAKAEAVADDEWQLSVGANDDDDDEEQQQQQKQGKLEPGKEGAPANRQTDRRQEVIDIIDHHHHQSNDDDDQRGSTRLSSTSSISTPNQDRQGDE